MLIPRNEKEDPGIILEFKVHDPEKERTLEDSAFSALKQIEEKNYEAELLSLGVPSEKIRGLRDLHENVICVFFICYVAKGNFRCGAL